MTDNNDDQYTNSCKKVWRMYKLIVFVIIILLVTLVAQDNEERLFFALMTTAAAYVFRPTDRYINKVVLKRYGVSPPDDTE